MPRRYLLADLIAIKERSGRRGGRIPDDRDLEQVKEVWEAWQDRRNHLRS